MPLRNRQKSVLFICTANSPGGMERVVLDLSREFKRRGWKTRAVFPAGEIVDGFEQWANAQGVEIELSDTVLDAAAEHSRADMFRLRKFIAQDRPDIVHFHYGSSFVSFYDILAARLAGVSRVYATLHQAVAWADLEPRKKKMTGVCGKWLLKSIVAICVQSETLLREAAVPLNKVRLIYCGVRVPTPNVSKADSRVQLGIDPDAFTVLTVASLTKRKGVDDVIRAVASIPDKTDSVRLLVAGDGPERANLEAQASEEIPGKAVFLGRVTGDMTHVYAAADVFVLASHAEGVPLVCHEAALNCLPTIATDVGGTSEAIIPNQTGFLIQPHSPSEISLAVQQMRNNPQLRQTMGKSAQDRAGSKFTDFAMAEEYEREFLK